MHWTAFLNFNSLRIWFQETVTSFLHIQNFVVIYYSCSNFINKCQTIILRLKQNWDSVYLDLFLLTSFFLWDFAINPLSNMFVSSTTGNHLTWTRNILEIAGFFLMASFYLHQYSSISGILMCLICNSLGRTFGASRKYNRNQIKM